MRYQGRISEWKDNRGFGFITPNGGGPRVFIHIKALRGGQPRPEGGELVSYEVATDATRGPRAQNVTYVGARTMSTSTKSSLPLSIIVLALAVAGLGAYGWDRLKATPTLDVPATPSSATLQSQPAPSLACQGKQYCSQMTSCAEAMYYLNNCPGVKIDGDGDGIPCEEQWCGGR